MTIGLTPRQLEVLRFLCAYHDQRGVMPTVNEIGAGIGVHSKSSVINNLHGLEIRGYIRRLPRKNRAIEILVRPEMPAPVTADALPPELQTKLATFCARRGETPANVIHDAVLIHIDSLEARLGD